MALNLSRNGPALQEAYGRVVASASPTDWALFTYEGNSNDLRVAGTGDGGLEEMVEELNSGKVMYAFCKVKDPNSGLPKYVLINWFGEGVNDLRKGACANHVSSVANFLKGSVYQKTNAMSEIKRISKDSFWAKAEKDEENRRLEEKRKAEEERHHLEKERREREMQEATLRERRFKERANEIDAQKKFQQQQETEPRDKDKQQWKEQEEDHSKVQKGFRRRSESVEKAQEAASLISQRSVNPRDIFKQKERSMSTEAAAVGSQPGKLRSPFLQENSHVEAPVSPVLPAVQDVHPSPVVHSSVHDTPPVSPVPELGNSTRQDNYKPGTPVYQPEVEHEAVYEEPPSQQGIYDEPPKEQADDTKYDYDDSYQQSPNMEGKGLCARALYDYQAADDTEISFDPENMITNIEMIDEGWWRGYGPDGHFGMFPANYVELIE
ncbi:drebrin-like protein isoform X4 [Elgaria multicarinata webbii]|uniref:drebrin-like protein isoform X4 n=1 Tax=Elgaria multicarinata webbii TaxID=159646 RepID=UPI002FCD197B